MLWMPCCRLRRRKAHERSRSREGKTFVSRYYADSLASVPATLQLRQALQMAVRAWTVFRFCIRTCHFVVAVGPGAGLEFYFFWRAAKRARAMFSSRNARARAEN